MESKQGNFKYDQEGKVVFEECENGRWEVISLNDKVSEVNTMYYGGIDPYQKKEDEN